MDKKHRGALSQLQAEAWLLEQGYEVFRNVSIHGPIDIVAIKGDTILKLDVKTARSVSPNSAVRLKPEQEARGVKALLVWGDGSFEIRDTKAWTKEREWWPRDTSEKTALWI